MTKYNDTVQPPPIATTGAVGNAFMASGLLVVVSFVVLLVTDTWRSPWALKAVLLVFALPILVAAGSRLCLMFRQIVWEMELYAKRDLTGDGVIGQPGKDNVRIIPVYGGKFIDEVDERDLAKFVEVICATGKFTQRDWQRYEMPSGRVVDNEYHARLIAPLTKLGFIIDRSERSAGKLIERNPDVIKDKIGLP